MFVSLVFLAILIALTTAVGVLGSNIATGLVCALMAVAVIGMALSLRPSAVGRLSRILRPALLVILFAPSLLMLLQAAPMPVRWLSDPVWASTSSALNLPMPGAVTIDIGATLLSFSRYCGVLAVAIVVASLTFDRQLAEITLFSLTAIAALAAGLQIISELGNLGPLGGRAAGGDAGATIIAVIGIVLSCAVLIHVREQLSSKRSRREFRLLTIIGLATAAIALALCTISIVIQAEVTVMFAAVLGAGIPISVFAIRRWYFGAWGKAGVVAAAVMILFGFLAVAPIKTDADPTIALSPERQAAIELMLSDARLFGRGAGSFEDLLPVYRAPDEGASRGSATAAAIITIEMGRAFLWIFTLALAAGTIMLIRGSLARSRDYVYAAAGAGILIAILVIAFVNDDLLSLTASLVASAALGLACAQSRSTSEDVASPAGLHGGATTASSLRMGAPYLDRLSTRLACALFGVVLMAEAAWVLLAEGYSSEAVASFFGPTHTAVSAEDKKNFANAASIAIVRGDVWAKAAFAGASLLKRIPSSSSAYDRVRDDLTQALRYAPYRGDVWLLFALLADQNKWVRYDQAALLKMAYYTAPNNADLIPTRIKLALRLNARAVDVELRDMMRRDVNLILTRSPALKPALLEAYKFGTPDGRALAERLIAEVDPGFLETARSQ